MGWVGWAVLGRASPHPPTEQGAPVQSLLPRDPPRVRRAGDHSGEYLGLHLTRPVSGPDPTS